MSGRTEAMKPAHAHLLGGPAHDGVGSFGRETAATPWGEDGVAELDRAVARPAVEADVADRRQRRLEQQQADRPRPVFGIGRERLSGEVGGDVELLEVRASRRRIDLVGCRQVQDEARGLEVGRQAETACLASLPVLSGS